MRTQELAALRREVDTLRAGRGRRYPAALRERIESAVAQGRSAGWSYARLASSLGIPVETLAKWRANRTKRTATSASPMVPVRVIDDAAAEAAELASFTLTSPGGYRVDHLGHADVVALLRELG